MGAWSISKKRKKWRDFSKRARLREPITRLASSGATQLCHSFVREKRNHSSFINQIFLWQFYRHNQIVPVTF
jgi:hypothetical protein